MSTPVTDTNPLLLSLLVTTESLLFHVMQDLRNKLKDSLNDKFFGVGAQSVLRSDSFTEQMKRSVEAEFCVGLQRRFRI